MTVDLEIDVDSFFVEIFKKSFMASILFLLKNTLEVGGMGKAFGSLVPEPHEYRITFEIMY